jgi:hypothetical protein
VGGVALLSLGKGEQDLAVLTGALGRKGLEDGGGLLLGGQAPPIPAARTSRQGPLRRSADCHQAV